MRPPPRDEAAELAVRQTSLPWRSAARVRVAVLGPLLFATLSGVDVPTWLMSATTMLAPVVPVGLLRRRTRLRLEDGPVELVVPACWGRSPPRPSGGWGSFWAGWRR